MGPRSLGCGERTTGPTLRPPVSLKSLTTSAASLSHAPQFPRETPATSPPSEAGSYGRSSPPRAGGGGKIPRGDSPFLRFVGMRLALIPIQLIFVLVLLYVSIDLPVALSTGPSLTVVGYFQGFGQMVVNIFTGNWGIVLNPYGPNPYGLPTSQLYADFLPNSIQLALFALPIAALIAYPLSLLLGWTRRPLVDVPARVSTLAGALLPVFVVGTLVLYALFFAFFNTFHDLDSNGLIPTATWFNNYYGSIPSWILYGAITRPTGLPLIDGVIHQAWAFEAITFTKTLIQASIIAIAYVAIFLRHARSLVASASQEPHVTAARSRGISERTLLWYHTGRRVTPTLLLVFALTVPGYLATQFVVEGVFNDPGVGFLTLIALTQGGVGDLPMLEGLIFVLAAFVLVLVFVADLVANRLDPRGARTQ